VIRSIYDYNIKSVNNIPSYVSGIHIRIGGRLLGENIIPGRSTKRFERGARSIGKVNYLVDASVVRRNRKGAYTVKISSGQNFF
jgi:hypothetical protein